MLGPQALIKQLDQGEMPSSVRYLVKRVSLKSLRPVIGIVTQVNSLRDATCVDPQLSDAHTLDIPRDSNREILGIDLSSNPFILIVVVIVCRKNPITKNSGRKL